jgi:D-glycero-alpha-D-manno-heptose-7-phosphate kinase
MVSALAMLNDRSLTADGLARLSYEIERVDLGISGGWQDQYAAAFGGMNLLEFARDSVRVTPARVSPERLRGLERSLLLCYTGSVRRNVGLIDRQIALHRQGREETHLGLKRLQEMAYAMRDAVEAGDIERLGGMLHEAFEAKKLMNPHIAEETPIEAMLAGARNAGAAGGKICGAGGGGYLLIAADPVHQPDVKRTLEAMGGQFATFRFTREGVRARSGDDVWVPTA